jgi:hypothetical protein
VQRESLAQAIGDALTRPAPGDVLGSPPSLGFDRLPRHSRATFETCLEQNVPQPELRNRALQAADGAELAERFQTLLAAMAIRRATSAMLPLPLC